MSQYCGPRARTWVMVIEQWGWLTTYASMSMPLMVIKTMVVFTMALPLFFGSGRKETTSDGRSFPTVSHWTYQMWKSEFFGKVEPLLVGESFICHLLFVESSWMGFAGYCGVQGVEILLCLCIRLGRRCCVFASSAVCVFLAMGCVKILVDDDPSAAGIAPTWLWINKKERQTCVVYFYADKRTLLCCILSRYMIFLCFYVCGRCIIWCISSGIHLRLNLIF